MHSISEVGTNVPAFLAKLWKLVEDPTTNCLITWSSDGSSFLIRNQAQFSRELLPLYYKHNNLASFIRQLNMYGFRKISSVDSGGLKLDKDEMEFAHRYFLRGHPYLLDSIKRKIPTGSVHNSGSMGNSATGGVKPELVSRVLQDVRQMKGRQENLDSRFNAMKRENETLWRELALLRQKHMKQQQIVNKLIQFLVTLVQPNRGLGIKRTYPLMLNDSPNVLTNSRRGPSQPKAAKLNLISDMITSEELSPKGPVLHELDNNVEYVLPVDSYGVLSDVEFVSAQEDAAEGAKVGAAAGISVDKLKSGSGGCRQGEPVSPKVGEEAGDVPVDLAKELDSVVPLISSPGNLDSMPSSPVANVLGVTTENPVEDIAEFAPDPQNSVPESCLLPSVEYPLSPEMFMRPVDPAVVSPLPSNKLSKIRGRGGGRVLKSASKSTATVEKSNHSQNNRKTKRASMSSKKNQEVETLTVDVYPEIHLEEGSSTMNEEEANLLSSLTSSEEINVNDLNLSMEQPILPEEGEKTENNDSNMALACTSVSPSGDCEKSSDSSIREELDMHIDNMQSELELLKETLMKGNVASAGGGGGNSGNEGDLTNAVGGLEGYCLDASALLGVCPASLGHLLDPAAVEGGRYLLNKLFSSDEPLPISMNSLPGSSLGSSVGSKGNTDFAGYELAAYNPNFLDLVENDDDDDSQLLNWYDDTSSDPKET